MLYHQNEKINLHIFSMMHLTICNHIDTKGNITLTYDPMDNITNIKGPLGYEYKYAYDTRNKINVLTFSNRRCCKISATIPTETLTTMNLPNGSNAQFTYDAMNRVKTITRWYRKHQQLL